GPGSQLGEDCRGCVDGSGGDHTRPGLPRHQQSRAHLGRRDVAEGAVGCGPRRGESCRHRKTGATRFATDLRPALSSRRWRTGSDSVPPRPRLYPDHRALPRLQTEASSCRQRPIGYRTRRRLSIARADTFREIRPARQGGTRMAGVRCLRLNMTSYLTWAADPSARQTSDTVLCIKGRGPGARASEVSNTAGADGGPMPIKRSATLWGLSGAAATLVVAGAAALIWQQVGPRAVTVTIGRFPEQLVYVRSGD